jgi:uncharacterized membrane protein YbhN (UPF0104 family)
VLFMLPVIILAALAMGRHPLSRPLAGVVQAWQWAKARGGRTQPTAAGNGSTSETGLYEPAISTHSKLGHFVITLRESEDLGSRLFRQRPWLLATAVVVTFVSWMVIVGEFWLMTHVLGLGLSLPDALLALLAARAAILLPLPAAVGALEASQALAMVSLGLPAAYGISLSLLIRGRDVLLGLTGLGLTTVYLQDSDIERVRG